MCFEAFFWKIAHSEGKYYRQELEFFGKESLLNLAILRSTISCNILQNQSNDL